MSVVRLRWMDRSFSEQGQRVYRDTKPIDVNNLPEPIAVLPPNVQEYEDANVLLGLTYYYIVSSFKDGMEKFSEPNIVDTGSSSTGPGPTTLINNNETAGFFGEVKNSDLIRFPELRNLLGLNVGNNANSATDWLKFVIDNKILFVARQIAYRDISWQEMYDRHVIFGDRTIFLQGFEFKVRLLKGLGPEVTTVPEESGSDIEATHDSEWNRLMYNITADHTNYHKGSQRGENWANYLSNDLYSTGASGARHRTVCQEYGEGKVVLRGSYTTSSFTDPTTYAGIDVNNRELMGWRPVLELVTM